MLGVGGGHCSHHAPSSCLLVHTPLIRLLACQGTVVAVTHDRYFLDNVAGWILELDRGSGLPFEGNYSGAWGPGLGSWSGL